MLSSCTQDTEMSSETSYSASNESGYNIIVKTPSTDADINASKLIQTDEFENEITLADITTVQSIQTEAVSSSATSVQPIQTEAMDEYNFQLPSPPVLNVSNVDCSTNYLSWNKIDGAESYMLYLWDEKTNEFMEYGVIDGTSCKDINLIPNTKYTYSVAAKFNDGILGEKSDAVDIYTYNLCATAEQDDWIYSCEYNNAKAKIIRTKTDNSITEDITDYSFESVKDLCISGNYIFLVEDLDYYSGRIIKFNITNKKTEVLEEFIPDNNFGWYEIFQMAVYKNIIYYVTYGFWSETDEPCYNLYTVDFNGNAIDVNADYNEAYSPISFLSNESALYIVWRDETIEEVETDDNYYLTGVYTDKCYVYNSATQEMFTVKVPEETSDSQYNFLKYDGEFLYIEIVYNDNKQMIKADSDGFEYISEISDIPIPLDH